MRLPQRKVMQKKERGRQGTKKIRGWSCSFRITGTAVLEQAISIFNIRAWLSLAICLLEDISSCAILQDSVPQKRLYTFPRAQETRFFRLIALFISVCAPFSAPSRSVSICIQHQVCIAHHAQFRNGWEATSLTSMPFLSMYALSFTCPPSMNSMRRTRLVESSQYILGTWNKKSWVRSNNRLGKVGEHITHNPGKEWKRKRLKRGLVSFLCTREVNATIVTAGLFPRTAAVCARTTHQYNGSRKNACATLRAPLYKIFTTSLSHYCLIAFLSALQLLQVACLAPIATSWIIHLAPLDRNCISFAMYRAHLCSSKNDKPSS